MASAPWSCLVARAQQSPQRWSYARLSVVTLEGLGVGAGGRLAVALGEGRRYFGQ